MFGINKYLNSQLDKFSYNRILSRQAFNQNSFSNPLSLINYGIELPKWVSLANPFDFEKASRFNPIIKSALNLLATSASNGKKCLVDTVSGEKIPWTDKNEAVQKLYKLLVLRPNPLQSYKEFYFQGVFYLKTFGNRYVYCLMPSGFDNKLDLMEIEVIYNLPSQYIEVKTTGKIYKQTDIKNIIEGYARINVNPVEKYETDEIIHFNEVNISSEQPSIMGISKLEVLRQPIRNTQMCFEAMNSILQSRGMQGIISVNSKDGQGTIIPLKPNDQKAVEDKFKNDFGLLNGQNPFLLSPVPIDYIKTVMSASEIGIYEEFSNNSIIIANEFAVPPELIKTYIQGATYENQVQSVRRLYQDTTIPMVDDEDKYMSYRLDTFKYGFEIKTSWDHIPALQEAFKEKAQAINMKGKTAKEAYELNIITVNQYLEMIEQPSLKDGDMFKFKWDKKYKPIENGQQN